MPRSIDELSDLSIDIDNHFKVDLLIDSMRSSANTLKGIAQDLVPYYKNVTKYDENAIARCGFGRLQQSAGK